MEGIAGEQVKAFEHINLGNITVFDGGNGGTSNFLNTLVKTVAPSLGVLDKLPIGETVKGIINPEERKKRRRKVRKNNSNGYSLGSNKCTRQTVLGLCQNVDNAVVSFAGARFARPKTVCFVSSGRRTLPLGTKRQHCPHFEFNCKVCTYASDYTYGGISLHVYTHQVTRIYVSSYTYVRMSLHVL